MAISITIPTLSGKTVRALRKNRINTLQELMIERDLGLLSSRAFDEKCAAEIESVCEKIDDFYEYLKNDIEFGGEVQGFEEDVARCEELAIRQDDDEDKPYVTVKDAVFGILRRNSSVKYNIDAIRKTIRNRYKGAVSDNPITVRISLTNLVNEGVVEKIGDTGFYKYISFRKRKNTYDVEKNVKSSKLEAFIDEHRGKEIEFRYRTERSQSEKRWRRTRVRGQDNWYMYTDDCYPSGRGVQYVKGKIVEYREII